MRFPLHPVPSFAPIVLAVALTACPAPRPAESTGLRISPQTASVPVNGARPLEVTANGALPARLDWRSSDETIATVDAGGVVTGVALGTAQITASSGNLRATASVNVVSRSLAPGEVGVLRPQDFVNGQVSVGFDGLGADERVAVIPVHATQDTDTDGLDYALEVNGIAPNAGIADQPTNPRATFETMHLRMLERNRALADERIKAGARLLNQGGVRRQGLGKCAAPYTVGAKRCDFFVFSSATTNDQTQIRATLRFESRSAYWFVQDEDAQDISDAELEGLANLFEATLVPSDRRYFGEFPDVDANNKVLIVFSHLLGPNGLLGYVSPLDFFADDGRNPRSNEGDIFYATTPGSVAKRYPRAEFLGKVMPATMVHELKHLIVDGLRMAHHVRHEELWLEEPSAVAAEQLAGVGAQTGSIQP